MANQTRTATRTNNQNRGVPIRSSIPIRIGRRIVGRVIADTFFKSITGSKHMLREPRAIAFDVGSLQDAEAAGARRVKVTDTETDKTYKTSVSTIWNRGFKFNRGFGNQIALAIGQWNRDNQPRQLSLFGASV